MASATVGLPAEAAHAVQEGIGGAAVVTQQMGPQGQPLWEAAQSAFVNGWTSSMWLSAGIAAAAAVFAFAWTPRRATATTAADASTTDASTAGGAPARDDDHSELALVN